MTLLEMQDWLEQYADNEDLDDDDRLKAMHVLANVRVALALQGIDTRLKQSHLGISP